MKRQLVLEADASTGESKLLATSARPSEPVGFIDIVALQALIPVSRGTLRNWMANGSLPYIKAKGRRVLFDWDSVRESLLRRQRGGLQ